MNLVETRAFFVSGPETDKWKCSTKNKMCCPCIFTTLILLFLRLTPPPKKKKEKTKTYLNHMFLILRFPTKYLILFVLILIIQVVCFQRTTLLFLYCLETSSVVSWILYFRSSISIIKPNCFRTVSSSQFFPKFCARGFS